MKAPWRALVLAAAGLALLPLATQGAAASGTWMATGSMHYARTQHTATRLGNGAVLVAGGVNCNSNPCKVLASAEVFNPMTGKWIVVYPMTTPRFDHTATLLPTGQVLVTGGCSTASGAYCSGALNTAELYNPKTAKWTATGSMTAARQGQSATLLPTGLVLIAGGENSNCTPLPSCAILSSAELYNPATGVFTPTGSMIDARANHTATLLTNGQVLITGGYGCKGTCDSAELYNPATGTFTSTAGVMSTTRTNHTATVLANGQVLIAGGMIGCNYGCSTLNTAELYNPVTGTFTPTGTLVTARYLHTANILPNGNVLVAGGGGCYSACALTSAEVYNAATGTWSTTGAMSGARSWQTATLLINGPYKGEVLVAGGYNFQNTSDTLASALLYQP